ncbi:hypothetical protein SUGI_1095520 [Cryptomeria japonica]|nr:hypothetical protein SUGI_1095520 [Cryptomeria japonica]
MTTKHFCIISSWRPHIILESAGSATNLPSIVENNLFCSKCLPPAADVPILWQTRDTTTISQIVRQSCNYPDDFANAVVI